MTLTVGIVGGVSRGKSSLVNALCGDYVAKASLQRQTLNVVQYIPTKLKEQFKHLGESPNPVLQPNSAIYNLEIADIYGFVSGGIRFVDFPGFNDANSSTNDYWQMFAGKIEILDHILFVVSAETAFVDSTEVETYKRVCNLADRAYDIGIPVSVVVNKVDDPEDEEINSIINDAKKHLRKSDQMFRVSSHCMFANAIKCGTYKLRDECAVEMRKVMRSAGRAFSISDGCLNVRINSGLSYDGDHDQIIKYLREFDLNNDRRRDIIDAIIMRGYSNNAYINRKFCPYAKTDEERQKIIADYVKRNKIDPFEKFDMYNPSTTIGGAEFAFLTNYQFGHGLRGLAIYITCLYKVREKIIKDRAGNLAQYYEKFAGNRSIFNLLVGYQDQEDKHAYIFMLNLDKHNLLFSLICEYYKSIKHKIPNYDVYYLMEYNYTSGCAALRIHEHLHEFLDVFVRAVEFAQKAEKESI